MQVTLAVNLKVTHSGSKLEGDTGSNIDGH